MSGRSVLTWYDPLYSWDVHFLLSDVDECRFDVCPRDSECENVEPTDDPRGFRCICAATGNPPVNGRCPGKESPRLKVNFLKKKKKFGGHKSLFVGPLKPLFWTSGDVFSGFQSQDGQPYSHLAEAYVIYLK